MLAYFDCFSGASGDMILGALIDAGVDPTELGDRLRTLRVPGYRFRVEKIVSKGVSGTRLSVDLTEQDHAHRHLDEILEIIDRGDLSTRVKEGASAIFSRLAESEAKIHGVTPQQIHFHEVGSVDAIVDITGAVAGLEMLGVEQVYCSALPTGGGTVECAHGVLPVPAPATLELIRRRGAPLRPMAVEAELVTPTGAAILTTLAEFAQPRMTLHAVGYGFGRRELPWVNALRLWVGPRQADQLAGDQVTVIETNIDDMPGELLAAAMERLLAAGALDVYFSPIQMKKNRPAVKLSVICEPEQADGLAALVLAETSTLGLRLHRLDRVKCERWQEHLETPWGPVLAKAKRVGERVWYTPEYEDAARLARREGVALADIYAAVGAAAFAKRPA